ncbi:MAG: NAD(P)(+) transhydrogenase (Re/Si-specific) subunit alpha, partial [Thermoanaerobaculia bacterium]
MPTFFVPKELSPAEPRVAATPETVRQFVKAGLSVTIEAGAGDAAYFPDALFAEAGASLVERGAGFAAADIVASVEPPPLEDLTRMKRGAILIALLAPHRNPAHVRALASGNIS